MTNREQLIRHSKELIDALERQADTNAALSLGFLCAIAKQRMESTDMTAISFRAFLNKEVPA